MAACLATTTAMISTIGTSWGKSRPSSSRTTKHWRPVFDTKYKNCGGRKMKRTAKRLTVSTGKTEDFFERSLKPAPSLYGVENLPAEIRLTFEAPADLLRVLTEQRVRVI